MFHTEFREKFPNLGRFVGHLLDDANFHGLFVLVDWVEPKPELEERFGLLADEEVRHMACSKPEGLLLLDKYLKDEPLFLEWYDKVFGE